MNHSILQINHFSDYFSNSGSASMLKISGLSLFSKRENLQNCRLCKYICTSLYERAKILWDFHIQTDKMVMANQPDIVVVDKVQRKAVVVDIAIRSDNNIHRKDDEKEEKYQGLKEKHGESMEGEGIDVACGHRSTRDSNLQTGEVAKLL